MFFFLMVILRWSIQSHNNGKEGAFDGYSIKLIKVIQNGAVKHELTTADDCP